MEDKTMLAVRNLNTLPSLLEDFFNYEMPYSWNRNWATTNVPAVNIAEDANEYRIEVAAPGLRKEDFRISLENDLLTVTVQKEEKNEENEQKYTRKEFNYSSFTRSFALNDMVNSEKVEASHKDGILTIHLPKKEEAKVKPAREIAIA